MTNERPDLEASARRDTPRETVSGDRVCMQCLHPLAGSAIVREPETGLLYCRCVECGTAAAMLEYPTITPWIRRMKSVAAAFFVTVDPDRDTPEALKAYMESFDNRVVALRPANADELSAITRTFRVFYRKQPTSDGSYTMDHTALIYLMDGDGAFFGTISYGEDAQKGGSRKENRRVVVVVLE